MTTRRGEDDDAIVLKNTVYVILVYGRFLMMWVILVSVLVVCVASVVARQINGLVMHATAQKGYYNNLFININSYVDLQRILFSPQQKLTSPVSN